MIAPTMPDLITALRAHLAGRRRAPRTIDTYTKIADAFLGGLADAAPTARSVEEFLARPRRDGTPRTASTRNQEFAALRSLARVATREKSWLADPTEGMGFAKRVRRRPAFLDEDEVRQLFLAAWRQPPARERTQALAILGILSQAGLRISELVGLDVGQVDLATGSLVDVRGKGDTRDTIDLNAPAVLLLNAWLREREARAPPGEPALFVSARRTRLAARTVENWFVKLRVPMGTAKKVSPHTMRHSYATNQLLQGTDVATVFGNMRHTDMNSTLWYLHSIDTRRKDAIRRLATTVPVEVLPVVGARSSAPESPPNPPKATVLKSAESPETSTNHPLDDQYGMVAKGRASSPPDDDWRRSVAA